jgi:hypothetical protein
MAFSLAFDPSNMAGAEHQHSARGVNRPPMILRMSNRLGRDDFASSVRSISGSRSGGAIARAGRQTWFVLSVTRTGCRAQR